VWAARCDQLLPVSASSSSTRRSLPQKSSSS
jgi:hypothetical protein